MHDPTFRPKRRNWNETVSEVERRTRITAGAIVAFLYGCGLRWDANYGTMWRSNA